jgi:hypothetical protein
MRATICGALMALTITSAYAAEENRSSANYMLPYCKLTEAEISANNRNALLWGRCFGIVEGIRAVFTVLKITEAKGLDVHLGPWCADIPLQSDVEQTVNIVVRYGELHPDETHAAFPLLVMVALREAWPCKN